MWITSTKPNCISLKAMNNKLITTQFLNTTRMWRSTQVKSLPLSKYGLNMFFTASLSEASMYEFKKEGKEKYCIKPKEIKVLIWKIRKGVIIYIIFPTDTWVSQFWNQYLSVLFWRSNLYFASKTIRTATVSHIKGLKSHNSTIQFSKTKDLD